MSRGPYFRAAEKKRIWELWAEGLSAAAIGRALGRSGAGVLGVLGEAGGVRPAPRCRPPRALNRAEREEISRGLIAGESLRSIAARLQRAPSTISREVVANGGRRHYRAWRAELRAAERSRRPKRAKLAACPRLRAEVEARLEERWSPQQIAKRLKEDFPNDPEMRVSHETIYQSLFVQGRGALRKELTSCLRSGRARRRSRRRGNDGRGELKNMVLISERPAEVEDRAVPGHWEGDLIMGRAGKSAIATLVERASRYVLLARLDDDHTAPTVRDALTRLVQRLPTELAVSLTWDRGREMAEHERFSIDSGIQVYFCDPHSPWQRGSNENTNGLLRQYFPKGTDLSGHTQEELDAVARQLNGRPRQTLGWLKPSEKFAEFVASTT